MLAFWQCIVLICIAIIAVFALIIGLAIVHCRRLRNRDNSQYIIARDMAGPVHYFEDSLSLSLPPLPTYYFVSRYNYYNDNSVCA